jgi:DNA-binding NarL/FixJ family response regulator
MKRYRTLVVEDDSQVREVLVETLRFSDFEAFGYDEAEKLLHDLDQSTMVPQNGPDLIVVDLELKADKMQGLDLIATLAKRDEPAEVLAISSKPPAADLASAMRIGVAAIVPNGVSEENKSHGLLGPIIEQYQYIDISQKFVDRLTVLFGRIDLRIMKEKKKQSRPTYRSAASARS